MICSALTCRTKQLGCYLCKHMLLTLVVFFLCGSTIGAFGAEPSLYYPACQADFERAGKPWCHFPWARRQIECDYTGYYVGGGAAIGRTRGRCPDEGTWGWDYAGCRLKRKVRLDWFCRDREQAGEGQYEPDGPRVVESIKHRLEHE